MQGAAIVASQNMGGIWTGARRLRDGKKAGAPGRTGCAVASRCPTSSGGTHDPLLRPSGCADTCELTSTFRTAGCGPACPMVWQGSSGAPLPPMPIVKPAPPADERRRSVLGEVVQQASKDRDLPVNFLFLEHHVLAVGALYGLQGLIAVQPTHEVVGLHPGHHFP